MSLTQLVVPTLDQMLAALSGWLSKAEKASEHADALLLARLAPDMFPLSTQIRFACVQAYEPVFRLKGEPFPEIWTTLLEEGRKSGDQPGTMADAQARIASTRSFLAELAPNALDSGADLKIAHEIPTGIVFDMTGEQYVRDWALPQFYFHVNTAYAILRNQGVEIGKADYVQHAFVYIRPGTLPAD